MWICVGLQAAPLEAIARLLCFDVGCVFTQTVRVLGMDRRMEHAFARLSCLVVWVLLMALSLRSRSHPRNKQGVICTFAMQQNGDGVCVVRQ
jgi:hypothetical protein